MEKSVVIQKKNIFTSVKQNKILYFPSENIRYALYFVNIFLYFATFYIIKRCICFQDGRPGSRGSTSLISVIPFYYNKGEHTCSLRLWYSPESKDAYDSYLHGISITLVAHTIIPRLVSAWAFHSLCGSHNKTTVGICPWAFHSIKFVTHAIIPRLVSVWAFHSH